MKSELMINFPLPILQKAYASEDNIPFLNLRPVLLEALQVFIGGYCLKHHIPNDCERLIIEGVSEDVSDDLCLTASGLIWENVLETSGQYLVNKATLKKFIPKVKQLFLQYHKEPVPYCSISVGVWMNYMTCECEMNDFQKMQLLAAMAIRSIIGPQEVKPIKWEFILSRMAGYSRMVKVYDLPEEVMDYDKKLHRKKKDRLIKALQKSWGIQYVFKGRKAWYCTNPKIDLKEFLSIP